MNEYITQYQIPTGEWKAVHVAQVGPDEWEPINEGFLRHETEELAAEEAKFWAKFHNKEYRA